MKTTKKAKKTIKIYRHKNVLPKRDLVKSRKQKKLQSKSKKISVKSTVEKIIDVVKKPFSNKPKKEKQIEEQNKETSESSLQSNGIESKSSVQQSCVDIPFAESSTKSSYSKFFCSSDYIFDTFDDFQLYENISSNFPGLLAKEEDESVKKSTVIDMLNDIDYMSKILKEYNMTILDFFKFLFRLCPSIFRGLFVKKIQKTIQDKPYAQSIRFGKYSFSRKRPSKRCSIF